MKAEPGHGLTPADAARAVLKRVRALAVERVPLGAAAGRVLGRAVKSPLDIPPWNNSAMDGYATRKSDLGTRNVELRVIETIPAGAFPRKKPGRGQCSRIFTGAPVPEECDTVIRQEDVTVLDGGRVRINDLRDAGKNVRKRGEDIRRGALVLEKGATLGPAQVGVLASVGEAVISAYRRPLVAILATGDEIVDMDQRAEIRSGRKIASSNSYTLAALIAEAGGVPVNLGIARDDPKDIARRLAKAKDADLIVTTAGVSVGDHDHVRAALDRMGLTLDFWRIRMRPGAPVGFGMLGKRPWIGLPGNPVSTMVAFELFVRPAIRRMLGHTGLFRRTTGVRAGEEIKLGPKLQHFLRVTLTDEGGALTARLTGSQSSGVLTSMAKAGALLIVGEDQRVVYQGETIQAIRLNETEHAAAPPF
ncbi:MAG: molybdopterin molybdenumtransferase MoeA [Gemmatimonadetes bacterium]|nr:molybdopterin molybdenumtransferase MoeA [Gemmatimonadota bacterium]